MSINVYQRYVTVKSFHLISYLSVDFYSSFQLRQSTFVPSFKFYFVILFIFPLLRLFFRRYYFVSFIALLELLVDWMTIPCVSKSQRNKNLFTSCELFSYVSFSVYLSRYQDSNYVSLCSASLSY